MVKISMVRVLGFILSTDLFVPLTYLLEMVIVHFLILFLQRKGPIVFVNVLDLVNTILLDFSLQEFFQLLNSLVPDGVGELHQKSHNTL